MHPSPSKVLLIRQVIWRLLGLGHFWERWPPACSAVRAQWTCAKALFFVRRLGIARLHLVHVGTSPWTENVKFDIRCKAFCDYTSHYRIEFLLKICARGQILIYSFCYFLLSFEKLCVVWDHGLVVFFVFGTACCSGRSASWRDPPILVTEPWRRFHWMNLFNPQCLMEEAHWDLVYIVTYILNICTRVFLRTKMTCAL